MQKVNRLLVIFVLTGLLISVCTRVRRPVRPSPEQIFSVAPAHFQKGLWVRAASMASPGSIQKIIEIAKKYNITDIYAQVLVGGYAYYPSKFIPRSQYLAKKSDPTYDPIDSLIHAAHECSIRVHAWVNTILAWSLHNPPDSSRHLFYTHPEWFIKDINNKSMIEYSADEWYDAGLEGMYLDPSNDMVLNYLKTACKEIIVKYPVVGIHLDFIRYPGVWWGLPDNDTTAMFRSLKAYNIRWFNLIKYPQSSFITRWMCWHYWQYARQKEKNIYKIVHGISEVIGNDTLYPGRLLTAAIFPNPGLARYRFAQNWMDWGKIIDYPVAMSYTDDAFFFSDLLDFIIKKRQDAIFGIGFIWPDMEVAAFHEVTDVIKKNGAGICFFDFTNLDTMVNFTKFSGESPAEEYEPLPEKEIPGPITDVFLDIAPSVMVENGKKYCTKEECADFLAFLLSLSLDQEGDLKKMGLTREGLLNKVYEDIAAFKILDSLVFPIGDTLIQPPNKNVVYAFIPWGDEDTIQIIEKAENIQDLTQEITVYPNVLNDLSRAAFSIDDDIKETFRIRRGIYVLKTKKAEDSGKLISRSEINEQLIPIYVSWTIENKVKNILKEY